MNGIIRAVALAALLLVCWRAKAQAPINDEVYNVRSYGARGDGATIDTDSINRAIDDAAAAGGGVVRFPAGSYLATSIHLKSGITLDLGPGATLIAAAPGVGGHYDAPEDNPAAGRYQDFGHAHWHNSLIWGEGLHDIAIVGAGHILGQGLERDFTPALGTGNKAIALKLCRGVTIRDITIQHGGWFGILATGVDNLTIENVRIDTNRDGMDIDCCRDVRVEDCSVNSPNDDGICLKSSYGLGFARVTENVTITNCQVSGYDEGTMLDGTFAHHGGDPTGRIKFGTESNGGFKNITVSNCVFACCRGLALEEVDGGALEDVSISNITMRDIGNAPIFLRLGGRLRGPAGTTMGTLRRISISHVTAYNVAAKSGILIAGSPDGLIEDVSLQDVHVWYRGGGSIRADEPREDETGYPEPGSIGTTPAYGLYIRHVRSIHLSEIELRSLSDDRRPAIELLDVTSARLRQVDAHRPGVTTVLLKTDHDFDLRDSEGLTDTHVDDTPQTAL